MNKQGNNVKQAKKSIVISNLMEIKSFMVATLE